MRRDFENYFTQLQLQYNKLQKDLEKVNKEISEGKVSDEQRENFVNYFNAVKVNYDRIAYARYLYRLPPKWIQKIEQYFTNKKIIKELKKYEEEHADQESILKENDEALNKIEEGLEKCKNS